MGNLFGETGLMMTAVGFLQTAWDVAWGLVKAAWDTFTAVIGTVYDNTWASCSVRTGLIAVAIGFVQTKWDEIWGLVKAAWDTFTGAIQTVWDTTLGLLFGETGLIMTRPSGSCRRSGTRYGVWSRLHGTRSRAAIQTVWDTTLALLFGETGLIAKAIGFTQTAWETITGLIETAVGHVHGLQSGRRGTTPLASCSARRAGSPRPWRG